MFPCVALAKDKTWQHGPYDGVGLMVLHKNEWACVLSGEWDESGVSYANGALFFAPKGIKHGPHVAKTEVTSLTIFDGPLTVA